jgi:hypothetical protein
MSTWAVFWICLFSCIAIEAVASACRKRQQVGFAPNEVDNTDEELRSAFIAGYILEGSRGDYPFDEIAQAYCEKEFAKWKANRSVL